jgi:predicted permease
MIDVLNLALPYFGLIFIGFACGKLKQIPDTALAWMNFFIVYVALPALFYRILAQTPLEQLAQIDFIFATTLATFWAFAVSFVIGMTIRRGNIGESTIAGLSGGYGNIGYMGPGLALATLGPQAAVPVALIFCFDTLLLFSLVPFLMAIASPSQKSTGAVCCRSGQTDRHSSVGDRDCGGYWLGGGSFPAASCDGAIVAVPAECGSALCTVHARRDRGSAANEKDAVGGSASGCGETRPAPGFGVPVALTIRAFRAKLGLHGDIDGGTPAGAQCVRFRPAIRYVG